MLNVEQITNRLAQMPDQALQKYAALHKNDPYIMALAVSESNRRKQMRNAAQGAQGMQEPPKVVDQEVQGMAAPMPEDMGIARIPAGNMDFADGGIVAFAGGGDVERYADEGFTGYSFGDWAASKNERRRKELEEERAANMAAVRQGSTYSPEAYGVTTPAPLYQDPRILGSTPAMPVIPAPKADRPAPLATAPAAAAALTPAAPTAKAATPAASPGLDALAQYQKDIKAFRPAAAKAPADYAAEKAALLPEEYRGKAHSALEKSLQTEAEAAGQEKRDAMWMSVMQAGLAAAAGASPNALKNIAEGLNVGVGSYKESLKEFKKAEKERQKMLADIDQARRAEARGDADAALNARDRAEERIDKYNGYAMQGLASITGHKVSGEYSLAGHRISAGATAAAAASSPERVVFNSLLAKHKGDAGAAYAEMASMKREPLTNETLMKAWTNNALLQTQYPNVQDYLKMMQGAGGSATQLNPSDQALINKYSR